MRDPRHPLFGRRFREATWAAGPSARFGRVHVFLRDELTIALPLEVIRAPAGGVAAVKVTPEAASALIELAGRCKS